ncbi:MAG: response regulator [Dechloromonas sp.]|nr:response regulator [Dechloromonas sp.]
MPAPLFAEQLEQALNQSGVAFWLWAERGEPAISANFAARLGYPADALPRDADGWLDLAHEAERPALAALIADLRGARVAGEVRFGIRLRGGDGDWRNFSLCAAPAAAGRTLITFNDITDALRTGQELARLVHERTAELENAHDTLAKIIDGSPVPAFVLDADHVITHWNAACGEIIGMGAEQMVGTRDQWRAFYPSARPVMADLVLDGAQAGPGYVYPDSIRPSRLVAGGFEAEAYFQKFDRWLFFTAAPLRDKQGRVIGAIETLQDVTERKRAELALIDAKATAEAAASAKTEFLANMSHEIRTPINAVIGLAHLLLKTELSVKQRDFVARIHGAGQILLGLVSDVLDFSKIEAGRMQIESTEFDLDEVLDNVATVVLQRVQEKGLELHYVVEPEVPGRLIGDPLRLAQVLINLVGNAIKFTARGSVTVIVRRLPDDEGSVRLEIDVQDTGIGMSASQQERLFQAFSQADSSITRKFGGTGLGLTICKRLTELMGGRIWVTSQPDVGSTFSFEVRLRPGGARDRQPLPPATRRALVVDDNPLARAILVRLLAKFGYAAQAAASGEEALVRLTEQGPLPCELITIDLTMPGMDGFELAETIQEKHLSPPPKLIMVTATDTAALDERISAAGFSGIVSKPVTAAQIGKVIGNGGPAASAARAPLAGLQILLVEDIPTNQLIAVEILESYGATVDTADNGRLALNRLIDEGRRYDAVLMDIQMPELDGLEATRRLRASGRWPGLPVIAMTAHALPEERQRCLAAGMNDFITKPVDPEVLRDTLLRWRPEAVAASTAPRPATTAAPAGGLPPLPGIDTADGMKRMLNKQALYERVLRDFHARFAGEVALLEAALAAGDVAGAERRAHSAKGLAGTIGARDLQATAFELETALREGQEHADALARFAAELRRVIDGIGQAYAIPPAA